MSLTLLITQFIRQHAGRHFSGYTEEALVDYVLFQWQQKSIAFCASGLEVYGVMVGWRQAEADPQPFAWQPPDPKGGFWYWDLLVTVHPTIALMLLDGIAKDHPECLTLPSVAWRKGKIRRYRPGQLTTLYTKGQNYGITRKH
jgi:hypothetical protein